MKRLIGSRLGNAVAVLLLAFFAVWAFAPAAHADGYCTTSRYSGMTFTTCRYSDPWQPATTVTCFDRTGHCTTREG